MPSAEQVRVFIRQVEDCPQEIDGDPSLGADRDVRRLAYAMLRHIDRLERRIHAHYQDEIGHLEDKIDALVASRPPQQISSPTEEAQQISRTTTSVSGTPTPESPAPAEPPTSPPADDWTGETPASGHAGAERSEASPVETGTGAERSEASPVAERESSRSRSSPRERTPA